MATTEKTERSQEVRCPVCGGAYPLWDGKIAPHCITHFEPCSGSETKPQPSR